MSVIKFGRQNTKYTYGRGKDKEVKEKATGIYWRFGHEKKPETLKVRVKSKRKFGAL